MNKTRRYIAMSILLTFAMCNVHGDFGGEMSTAMCAMDFCGIESTLSACNPLTGIRWHDRSVMPTIGEFKAEPTRGMPSGIIKDVFSHDLKWLHVIIVMAECAYVTGDVSRFYRCMEYMAELTITNDKFRDVVGDLVVRHMYFRLEYLLGRIVNDRRSMAVKLKPDEIRKFLPAMRNWRTNGIPDLHCQMHQATFRNMLIVGASLEVYLRSHGHLPDSLHEIADVADCERLDAYGNEIHYRKSGLEWILHSGGVEKHNDDSPWDVYIPCIGQSGGMPTEEVWFASTYSQKRKTLYVDGVIQEDSPLYQCYMKENVIYRGHQAGTPHKEVLNDASQR